MCPKTSLLQQQMEQDRSSVKASLPSDVKKTLSVQPGNVRTVTFNERVTLFTPNDWSPNVYSRARKGPWLRYAVDRFRFQRRIEQTEEMLGDIFSESHRDKVERRLFNK